MILLRTTFLSILIASLVLSPVEINADSKKEAKTEAKAEKKEEKKEDKAAEKKEKKKDKEKEEKRVKKEKAKKEKEAKAKAEKEAKAKAEKEAKAKAEKEAKAKAEKEVKAKAEKEAKAKAEKEAKAKAEKEVKAKAEKEAKAKAEKEAKAKAEEKEKAKKDKKAKVEKKVEKEEKKVDKKAEAGAVKKTDAKVDKKATVEKKPAGKSGKEVRAESDKKEATAVKSEPEKKKDSRAEKKARAKAEKEARAKAEAEKKALAKAEQEAKAKAEKEAKAEKKPDARVEKEVKPEKEKKAEAVIKKEKVERITVKGKRADIAVYDLYTTFEADSEAALIISDRIRTELIKTGKFKVMERREMKEILSQQTFQYKDTCHSQSCMTDVGHLIGVDRLVYGSVANVKNFFTVVLRMVNVPRGEVLSTVTEDMEGDIKKIVSGKAQALVKKLIEKAGYTVAQSLEVTGTGTLHIDADKVGASIFIDGEKISKKTPTTLEKFPVGKHWIVVRDKTSYGAKEVTLFPGGSIMATVALNEKKGKLFISSSPSKAKVIIEGKEYGETPVTVELIVGEYKVQVKKEGYFPQETLASVGSTDVKNLEIDLKGAAYLSVKAQPEYADIIINGEKAGTGFVDACKVEAGEVELQIEATEHALFKTTEHVKAGEKKTVEKKLDYLFGSLEVKAKPEMISLFLNDVEIGTTPYTNERLRTGTYKLTLVEDTYNGITEDVIIKPSEMIKREYTLKHTEMYRDSLRREKWTKNGLRGIRRILFSSFAVLCGAAGYYFEMEAGKSKEDMDEAVREYNNANSANSNFQVIKDKYYDARSRTDTNIIRRNLCIGAAGILGTGFFISIFF